MITIICEYCHKDFQVHGRGMYQTKFCCKECENKYNERKCIICGILFSVKSRRKTCSIECENILRSESLSGLLTKKFNLIC